MGSVLKLCRIAGIISYLFVVQTGFNKGTAAPLRGNTGIAFQKDSTLASNRLVHTKLQLSFNYPAHQVIGTAWITVKTLLPQDNALVLDAKSMDVSSVTLEAGDKHLPLVYTTDGKRLHITLDKPHVKDEAYTVAIHYVAKPDQQDIAGTLLQSRGIYFVKAGEQAGKPQYEVWTQGETSGSSAWFPTIDQPDQRCTSEISLTVPAAYTTLSNGILTTKTNVGDSARTDTWVMNKPHAPYLFMVAAGTFDVYHDTWKNIPVDYYLEPAYSAEAKAIFGKTPEMIQYFSDKIGYAYPWPKYSQIVVKNYFSGGMENTTATLFGSLLRKQPRAFIGNEEARWVVAHELFHQWFGDLVTCQGWSKLALNESFANFGEILWGEHAYGQDAADHHAYEGIVKYITQTQGGSDHPLIYTAYQDDAEMFDAVTYEKGGAILNMLRDYVGDDVFFRALKNYLSAHAYQAVSEKDLQAAFEKESGQDLRWFWAQWFYKKGYPILDISYVYHDADGKVDIKILQQQKDDVYKLPVKVAIYAGGKTVVHDLVITQREQVFTLPYAPGIHPDLVNVDANKKLLGRKTDHKTLEQFIWQYKNATGYLNRREALKAAVQAQDTSALARSFLATGLQDPFEGLRKFTLDYIDLENAAVKKQYVATIENIARKDAGPLVRQAAIKRLRSLKDESYAPLFVQALQDSSYDVVASSLIGLNNLKPALAAPYTKQFLADDEMASTLLNIYVTNADAADNAAFLQIVARQDDNAKQEYLLKYLRYLASLQDADVIASGLQSFQQIAAAVDPQFLDRSGMLESLELLANFKKDLLHKAGSAAEKTSLEKQVASINTTIHALAPNIN